MHPILVDPVEHIVGYLESDFGEAFVLPKRVALLSSMRGRGRGSSVATKAPLRGECGKDGVVPCGREAPLSWFF